MNSDAIVRPDCIGRLEGVLARGAGLGIVAPTIVSQTPPPTILSAGISYSVGSGRMRNLGHGELFRRSLGDGARQADAVSGCVMLIEREVLDRIGLFDEDYFFSYEDVDFCLRAARAGFRSACVLGAVAFHLGSHSIGLRSPLRVYYGVRNHLLLAERGHPGDSSLRIALRKGSVLLLSLGYALTSPEVPRAAGLKALVRGVGDHVRRRYGPACSA
jgi:GT2 family glycosyltransferase